MIVVMLAIGHHRTPVAVIQRREDFPGWKTWIKMHRLLKGDEVIADHEGMLLIRTGTGSILEYYPHGVELDPHLSTADHVATASSRG